MQALSELQVDSMWIPDGIRRNCCWHSAGITAEFHSIPGGIPVKMQAGIPPEIILAFHQNSSMKMQVRIPLELRTNNPVEITVKISAIISWVTNYSLILARNFSANLLISREITKLPWQHSHVSVPRWCTGF